MIPNPWKWWGILWFKWNRIKFWKKDILEGCRTIFFVNHTWWQIKHVFFHTAWHWKNKIACYIISTINTPYWKCLWTVRGQTYCIDEKWTDHLNANTEWVFETTANSILIYRFISGGKIGRSIFVQLKWKLPNKWSHFSIVLPSKFLIN